MQLWTMEFNGMMNKVSRASLSRDVLRDGVDERVQFHIFLDAAAPLAILRPSVMKDLKWSKHHTEQIHTMRGEFTYAGKTIALNGMGARDHSSGPRNSAGAIGAFWANILFDNGVVMNFNIARPQHPLRRARGRTEL